MALQTTDSDGLRRIQKTVTINRPAEELYAVWRDLERLPEFMDHVQSVTTDDTGRSHWVVKAPAGQTVEWDARISEERVNEYLAWQSVPDTGVVNFGEVTFRPAPHPGETEVRVSLAYEPPAGRTGAVIAKMFGEEPSQQLDEDLYRFKQIMETGTIPSVDGQVTGRTEHAADTGHTEHRSSSEPNEDLGVQEE